MFILIIFSDIERSGILKMVKFEKMRDVIHFTNNRVNYYDVGRDNALIKYKTQKSLFEVIKIC
jgi:hypothetical protein